jgi:hypothetical protein
MVSLTPLSSIGMLSILNLSIAGIALITGLRVRPVYNKRFHKRTGYLAVT